MSGIKRYDSNDSCEEVSDGDYVKFADHAAEISRIQSLFNTAVEGYERATNRHSDAADKYIEAMQEIARLRAELDNAAAAALANMSLACEKEREANALRVDAERRGWQPMATAPDDGSAHIRGLWVHTVAEGKPDRSEWRQYVGYLNDYREFVDPEYGETFGWDSDQYEAWMPVAEPPADAAMGADA